MPVRVIFCLQMKRGLSATSRCSDPAPGERHRQLLLVKRLQAARCQAHCQGSPHGLQLSASLCPLCSPVWSEAKRSSLKSSLRMRSQESRLCSLATNEQGLDPWCPEETVSAAAACLIGRDLWAWRFCCGWCWLAWTSILESAHLCYRKGRQCQDLTTQSRAQSS